LALLGVGLRGTFHFKTGIKPTAFGPFNPLTLDLDLSLNITYLDFQPNYKK
jgi:hypothetical protein